MIHDEVITHAEILQHLSPDVRHTLTLALPPEQRGWWTAAEIADSPRSEWIDVTTLGSPERRFVPGRQ